MHPLFTRPGTGLVGLSVLAACTTPSARLACVMLACVMAAVAPHAAADPESAAAPDSLTLRQVTTAALRDHPELAEFEPQLRTQEARTRRAGQRPAPELAFGVENVVGSGDAHGLQAAEATLALSQVVELGAKRAARVAAGQAASDLVAAERMARELDVLAAVTRRFIAMAERQEQLGLAGQGRTLAERLVAAVTTRVEAARSPHAELDRAHVALERARLAERRAIAEVDAARLELATSWGADRPALNGRVFTRVQADLYALPALGTFEDAVARYARSPDVLRFATELRLREAELRLAETAAKPDFALSLGVRRLEAGNDQALVASVSVPLFAGRRAGPAIDEARANRDLSSAQMRSAGLRARAVLFALYRGLQSEIESAQTLQRDLLPRAAEALKETRYAYERGRYSFVELVDAQQQYLDLQGALIAACARAHLLRAEIERLTREPLKESVTAENER